MAQTGTISSSYVVGGISFTGKLTESAEGTIAQVVALPAGNAGVMKGTTGIDGLETGHGLSPADVVDIHYTDTAGVHKVRTGIAVDTLVGDNEITMDNAPPGEGDALPPNDTALVVTLQVPISIDFTGNNLLMIAMKATQRAVMDFAETITSKFAHKFDAANDVWSWDSSSGFTNPLAGATPNAGFASNGSVTAATLTIGMLLDTV